MEGKGQDLCMDLLCSPQPSLSRWGPWACYHPSAARRSQVFMFPSVVYDRLPLSSALRKFSLQAVAGAR